MTDRIRQLYKVYHALEQDYGSLPPPRNWHPSWIFQ
jgi:hypothetical protein